MNELDQQLLSHCVKLCENGTSRHAINGGCHLERDKHKVDNEF